ncbi:hypothetical protein DsansV1_C27g0202241 [Dioscorea sansibarensis]
MLYMFLEIKHILVLKDMSRPEIMLQFCSTTACFIIILAPHIKEAITATKELK